MILPDVNILIYAHNEADERFERASSWFQRLMTSNEPACFCWETIQGFIRISTNQRAGPRPISIEKAISVVDSWLSSANAMFLRPSSDHYDLLRRVAIESAANGPLFSDAVLAAYAISHHATIATTDRDFRLFDGITLINPLA